MKNFIYTILFLIISVFSFSSENTGGEKDPVIPMLPILPSIPNGSPVPLETKTVIMKMETEVIVPLEIISDIEIQAMVIDEQEIRVPFEVEVNRNPDKQDFYKLNYSETEIDIDNDGEIDTYIYSNQFINSKVEKENYVLIKGKNISKEGYHEKVVYITVETHD